MDWLLFSTFLAACAAAATTGAMFKPEEWYFSLTKPWWTPPGWVFPLAWTSLYLCMSYAAMRIALLPDNAQALAFWSVQIALNTLWTPVFFGLRRLKSAMGVMVFLWSSVAITTALFMQMDTTAGLVMLPYLLWVTIAGALNFSVMRMNPGFAT